jgi:hypothetical protein
LSQGFLVVKTKVNPAQMMMLQSVNPIIKLQFTARNGISAGSGL